MTELIDTLQAILSAQTGSGLELEGLNIILHENAGLKSDGLVIRREREDVISQAQKFKAVQGRVGLTVMMIIDKRSGSALEYQEKEDQAEVWARKVEKVIMANPGLALDPEYSNGFTQRIELTEISSKEYGTVEDQAGWWIFCKMILNVQYFYRNGTIARS